MNAASDFAHYDECGSGVRRYPCRRCSHRSGQSSGVSLNVPSLVATVCSEAVPGHGERSLEPVAVALYGGNAPDVEGTDTDAVVIRQQPHKFERCL